MRWLKSSIAAIAFAAICLAQTGSPLANENVRRVGNQLMCLCGCGSTVTSCNMLHCHFSDPAREKILAMVEAGNSDDQILKSFVAEHGQRVMLTPPSEGFYVLGWIMPFIALAMGGMLLYVVLRRFRAEPAVVPAAVPGARPADDADLARYQEQIDRDMAKLE